MQFLLIQRLVGLFLVLFSFTLTAPLLTSIVFEDGEQWHFLESMLAILVAGVVVWFPVRKRTGELRLREAFLLVTLFWVILGIASGMPLILGPHLGIIDSTFESVSAFTTTGATVIQGLDQLPSSILMYRQFLQWLGGMGVVLLAVAILPMLGIGGMQLYRAETPGPIKDDKLTPRIQHAVRSLWVIYIALTAGCAFAYLVAGMSGFDAIAHSFATVSTGGFSTHDASLGYFNSPTIETIAVVFMLLGAINFGIHLAAIRGYTLRYYWQNTEVKVFLLVVLLLTVAIGLELWSTDTYKTLSAAMRYSLFQVVSVITSTGFTTTDFTLWPLYLPVLLIFSSFMGGCSGSTAGGIKMIRVVVLFKQGLLELRRLLHPRLVRPIKLHYGAVSVRTQQAIWGFFSTYVAIFIVFMLLLMAAGEDQVTAFASVATCLNNLGPGLGEVSSNFSGAGDLPKVLLTVAMLLGRLEIFTVLVLLTPAFWRR